MGTNYDALYARTPDALGPPTPAIVEVFADLGPPPLRVLDVGCGQGRDAIFIARLGHRVTGVDLSPHGIRSLTDAAAYEGFAIEGVVADIRDYSPRGAFDVVLIDRTLHMLAPPDRHAVLARLLDHVAAPGWLFIADEPANLPGFSDVIAAHPGTWETVTHKRGYLFVRRHAAEAPTPPAARSGPPRALGSS